MNASMPTRSAVVGEDEPEAGQVVSVEAVLGEQSPEELMYEDRLSADMHYAFGGDMVDEFEDKILPKQVPGYKQMRYRTMQVGCHFVTPGTTVLDMGTSQAKTIRDLIAAFSKKGQFQNVAGVQYTGVDSEEDQLVKGRLWLEDLSAQVREHLGVSVPLRVALGTWDLRNGLPLAERNPDPQIVVSRGGCSLITAVLTVQFVPVEYRQGLLREVYEALHPGGAFLMVEKVLANNSETTRLLTEIYHAEKARHGMSQEAIERKRASIEGFLVPQRSAENRSTLVQAGFRNADIDVYWRDLQFEALMAVKER